MPAFPGKTTITAKPTTNGADEPITRLGGAVTAFVGRTLRGPINRPVHISSYVEFQQEFGGLWQPSMLSYAVEHFFEQGGRSAVVVRVVNGGASATLELPCETGALSLQALAIGTREYLRAAVDYDNLSSSGAENDEHTVDSFNLVIQRVRGPGSERIEIQETHRRVSVHPGTQRFVANVLLESKLVRVCGKVPACRPLPTYRPTSSLYALNNREAAGYVQAGNDGDDGRQLTDYDLIGSAVDGTGLFALKDVENVGFVYIPPIARDVDLGACTLLVAEKFCRERRAILIVDPPSDWQDAEQATARAQALPFRSEHAVMYFPRLIALDRLRARSEVFPNGGAVAGMLARAEEQRPAWATSAPDPEYVLRSGVRLHASLNELDRWRLAMQGINTLRSTRSPMAVRLVPRTLSGGVNGAADSGYLAPQRLFSLILNSIERGTRWVTWSRCDANLWPRVSRQVTEFLSDLVILGAFPGASAAHAFMVACDQRINSAADIEAGRLKILIVVAGSRVGRYHGFLITHSPEGSSIKRASVNHLELPLVAEPQILSAAADEFIPSRRA